MIRSDIQQTLDMIRRAPRGGAVAVPTKRPRGGRPNPCASHGEARHPAAIARLAGRPHGRNRHRGNVEVPPWQRFTEAVQRGDLPVGTVESKQIARAIGQVASLTDLALRLASEQSPDRLREASIRGQYVISLV